DLLLRLDDQDLGAGQRQVELLVGNDPADGPGHVLGDEHARKAEQASEKREPDLPRLHHGSPSPSRTALSRLTRSASGSARCTGKERRVAHTSAARGREFGFTTPSSTALL